jgi:hypothetical protein
MSTVPNSAEQTDEPQVFRRRSTVIAGWVIAVLLVVLSTLLTIDEWSHGFFPAIAGPVTGLTLGLLAVLLSVWPHVIVRDEYLEPHNSFVWYQVPYPTITDISMIRMGLVVRTHGRKVVPLTGYASGAAGRVLGHGGAAGAVIDAVEAKMARRALPGDDNATITRHLDTRNVYAMLGAIVVTVVVIFLAVQTYH